MQTSILVALVAVAAATIVIAKPSLAADRVSESAILPLLSYYGKAESRDIFLGDLRDVVSKARSFADPLTADNFQRMLQQRRAGTIAAFLESDLNNDLQVTAAEIGGAVADRTEVNEYYNIINRMDADGDDIITLEEARVHANWRARYAERLRSQTAVLDLLLKLDPNGDGAVTADELEEIADAAFAVYDVDGSGALSRSEARALDRERTVIEAEMQFRADTQKCRFPSIEDGQKILLVVVNSAAALSSLSLAGQVNVTQTAEIAIEAGDEPLYILAASEKPMIWRISGHTERVARFAAYSSLGGVGAVGLPREKTMFATNADCLGSASSSEDGPYDRKQPMERLLGRPIDGIFVSDRVEKVSLPSMASLTRPEVTSVGAKPVTPTFSMGGLVDSDAKMVAAFRADYPAGLQQIDPATVVTSGRVERYQVLPGAAGILQLLKDGSIERHADGIYVIRKAIPPLWSAHQLPQRTKLFLPADLPVKGGDTRP